MKNILKTFVILMLFVSCQKELPVDNIPKISFLIKTATETRNGISTTTNFYYDSEGKVLSSTSTSGENKVFKYNSNSYKVTIYNGTILSGGETYFINNLSLIDSAVFAGKIDTTSRKYIYSSNKWLVQVKDYKITNAQPVLTKTTTAEYDANGNVSREYNSNNNQISYEYTNFPFTLNVGLIYFTHNRDFIKTSTFSGYLNKVFNYSYIFDSSNRVTNETVVDKDGGNIIVSTDYTY